MDLCLFPKKKVPERTYSTTTCRILPDIFPALYESSPYCTDTYVRTYVQKVYIYKKRHDQ